METNTIKTQSNLEKWGRRGFYTLLAVMGIWVVLTIWVEMEGENRKQILGMPQSKHRALIVYDADPIYNLDQQICTAFGRVMADSGWAVTIATVPAANDIFERPSTTPQDAHFDLYVLCANTYNWSPDWAITQFIKTKAPIEERNIVAITLGSGDTKRSQRLFESAIWHKQGVIFDTKSFWLSRPNDESRLKESNVTVAVSMTTNWAKEIVSRLNKKRPIEQNAVMK
jgi:hypothetical protein